MRLKAFGCMGIYETPAIVEIDVISEGILCESNSDGSSAEKYDRVEDLEGWGF
jgi:hypothetical protein